MERRLSANERIKGVSDSALVFRNLPQRDSDAALAAYGFVL